MPSPPWSDRNVHDPGLTLLQLLAWLAVALAFARALDRRRHSRT